MAKVEAAPADAVEAAVRIARALEARGVPYAIGGALAYGHWAIPRGTLDVDINIFVDPDALEPVFGALDDLGVPFDRTRAREEASREGMLVAWMGAFRLDLFTPSIDFSWEAARTRVRQRLGGDEVFVLSPEAIAVFKLLFFRPKDIVDLERLIEVRGPRLDRAYVRHHVVTLLGADDERVRTWDGLVAELGA